jgi:hypothetical protein
MYECGACALRFSSLRAFDSHRVGRHAYSSTEGLRFDPPREDGRRCLVAHELPDGGFVVNGTGLWGLVVDRDRALGRFPADPRTGEGHSEREAA